MNRKEEIPMDELLKAANDLVEYLGKDWRDDSFVLAVKKAIKKAKRQKPPLTIDDIINALSDAEFEDGGTITDEVIEFLEQLK